MILRMKGEAEEPYSHIAQTFHLELGVGKATSTQTHSRGQREHSNT